MTEVILNYSFLFLLFILASVFRRSFYNNPGLRFNISELPAQVNKLYVSGCPHWCSSQRGIEYAYLRRE